MKGYNSPNINKIILKPNIPTYKLDKFMAYVSKSLCKIHGENIIATGFLIKLLKGRKDFFCLITCEHVITRSMIRKRKKISFFYDSIDVKTKIIELNTNKRYIQVFKGLYEIDNNIDIDIDATVIEILPEDNIPKDYFLSLNENYINNPYQLKNKDIAIIQYPEGNLEYSYGKILEIYQYEITHSANTKHGSSGSPIFLKNSIQVIAIHKSGDKINKRNFGDCLGPIFNYLKNFSKNKKEENNNIYQRKLFLKKNKKISINKNIINNKDHIENIDDININEEKNNQLNKMTSLYKIKEYPIQIFGKNFVKNNKNNCYLLINGEEKELCSKIYDNKINLEKGILPIILIEKNPITNLSYMFHTDSESNSLLSLPDISEWNTINVTNMSNMFSNCTSLVSLPDISKWNTINVNNMSSLFSFCTSLISLPDISKWNIINVTNMSKMFSYCTSLVSLPDISKWNTKNVTDMTYMFENITIDRLPDISTWNTMNVKSMFGMFSFCRSLKSLPDISKWNTKNVNNMGNMFEFCELLESLPDISEWKTKNVSNMSKMFSYCGSLKSLPDISIWKTKNVSNMSKMFSFCNSLNSFRDISKWELNEELDYSSIFLGCKGKIIPEKFKESKCLIN